MGKPLKFIIILLIAGQLIAQEASQYTAAKPPLKPGKVAVEFLASGVVGMGLGYLGGMIGASVSGSGWDALGGAIIGIGIGYPLGSTTGAWLVGNTQNEQSNFWAVLGSSFLGAGLGFLALTQFESGPAKYLYLALVPLGATIGHNLNRRHKAESGHALLNFNGNQLYWSMPSPVLNWQLQQKKKYNTQFQLISVSF